jgi:hypothetical protein
MRIETTPDDLARMICASIREDLGETIKKQLLENIDPIITKMARELAASTLVHMAGYYTPTSGFDGPKIEMHLSVNNQQTELLKK